MSRYKPSLQDAKPLFSEAAKTNASHPFPDQTPPPEDVPYYLESFERSAPELAFTKTEPRLLQALNLRTLWAWARQETAVVPRETFTALLKDHETLQADNARLRESLARAESAAASAQAKFLALDAEVGSVLRDLIEPNLPKP